MIRNNDIINSIIRKFLIAFSALLASAMAGYCAPEGSFISRLDDLDDESSWFISDFAIKQQSFLTAWKHSSVIHAPDGGVSLALVPAPAEAQKDFFGAEVQRRQRTHFGRYEVVMTAARGEGVISSFFTYTGPHFGDPHDEIDLEFLGRDTTKVWLNRFVDGQKLPGRWLDLGFDSAEGPHLYRFDWFADRLVWYVDGRELLRVTADEMAIPQTPQRIYLNIWAGGVGQAGWSGKAPDDMRAQAQYYCVSYRSPDSETPTCSDVPMPVTSKND